MSICSGSIGSSFTLLDELGSSDWADDPCTKARSLARSAAGIVGGVFADAVLSDVTEFSRTAADTGDAAADTGAGAAILLVEAGRRYALIRA